MGFDGTSYKPSTNQAPPYIKRWAKLVVGILRKSDSSDPQISFIIIRMFVIFFSKIVMDSLKTSNLAFYIWLFMFYMRIVFLKYFQKVRLHTCFI